MSDKVPSLRLVDSDESSRAETTHRTVGQHLEQAELLVEILPYIQRWRGKVVVIKFGGNAMTDASLAERFAEDVVLMHQVGILPLIVHGGGPQIGELMERLGKEPEFKDGLRVTDAETLDIARMVLVGKVNREIVSSINVQPRARLCRRCNGCRSHFAAETVLRRSHTGYVHNRC